MRVKVSTTPALNCVGRDFPINHVGVDSGGDVWISDDAQCVCITQTGAITFNARKEWPGEPIRMLSPGETVNLSVENEKASS